MYTAHSTMSESTVTDMTAMPVMAPPDGRGLTPEQRLHQRSRAAALDLQGCLETGILSREQVTIIRTKRDLYVTCWSCCPMSLNEGYYSGSLNVKRS